jgi:hypothetical protein
MKRALTIALVAGIAVVTVALPVWAKGGETTGATLSLSGPGVATPLSLSGKEGLKVADWAGALNLAGGVSSAPNIELGPMYVATYTLSCTSSGSTGVTATLLVTQDVYPFAAGGPWTHMLAGQNRCDGGFMPGGWLATGPAFLNLLVQDGFPSSAPVPAAPAAPLATPGHSWNPWAFLLVGALMRLLAAGAVSARGWRRPQRVLQ